MPTWLNGCFPNKNLLSGRSYEPSESRFLFSLFQIPFPQYPADLLITSENMTVSPGNRILSLKIRYCPSGFFDQNNPRRKCSCTVRKQATENKR